MTNQSTPNKTVLVTGGSGYIGGHAVLALLDAGFPVVVIDNLTTGQRSAVPTEVPFYQYDAGDREFVGEVIRKHEVGAIMHFAGSIVMPESAADRLKNYGNNTAQSRDQIETEVLFGVPHFIFSSTAAVYGERHSSPVSEDCPPAPINPYGMSKRRSKIMLADTARAHGFDYCALRDSNAAGADPACRAGQSSADATHLTKVAVQAALGQRSHVDVYADDYDAPAGTGVRDYIHVSDLAAAHVLALEALIAQPKHSLGLNCGYGRGFSVTRVLDAVERVAKVTVDHRRAPRRSGDRAELVTANAALIDVLPWTRATPRSTRSSPPCSLGNATSHSAKPHERVLVPLTLRCLPANRCNQARVTGLVGASVQISTSQLLLKTHLLTLHHYYNSMLYRVRRLPSLRNRYCMYY